MYHINHESLQTNLHIIIEGCKRDKPVAQEQLYRHCYAPMIKICLRYCGGDAEMAGGVYNQAMLKVFTHIGQYNGKGEIEAWIRAIVVNTCIDYYRSKLRFRARELNEEETDWPVVPDIYNRISSNEIIRLIHELPKNTGFVFNLFVLEGYKHEEIGKILGISTGTSKWHLNEARKLLKQKLEIFFKKESLANAS